MMRILWLSHLVPYPPKGGVLQRAYYLLREIARYHEVDLLAFNQPDLIGPLYPSIEEGLKDAKQILGTICRQVEFQPIPAYRNHFGRYTLALKSLFTQDPYTINWLKSGEFSSALQEHYPAGNYDLVHFDTISLIPYFPYYETVPCVLDHHNIESHMLLRRAENEPNRLKKWYFYQEGRRLARIERQFCPKFTMNITCSDVDAERLKNIASGSRVEEVPNGVDIESFKSSGADEINNSLIFIGTLSWYPNIEAVRYIAYELWPKLKSAIPGIYFDIVGANPPDDIKQISDKDDHFRVHGFVDDVRPYFDQASVFVCPIKDGGGTKLKILDAFAMQKAVVAHPIACEGIQVSEGKNVLFADSVDKYVEHISRLLKDERLRKRIGKEARLLIEQRYAYNAIGQRLSALYEECVRSFHAG